MSLNKECYENLVPPEYKGFEDYKRILLRRLEEVHERDRTSAYRFSRRVLEEDVVLSLREIRKAGLEYTDKKVVSDIFLLAYLRSLSVQQTDFGKRRVIPRRDFSEICDILYYRGNNLQELLRKRGVALKKSKDSRTVSKKFFPNKRFEKGRTEKRIEGSTKNIIEAARKFLALRDKF